MSDATKLVEEIKSTLATIQEKQGTLENQGLKSSEGMEALKKEFDKAFNELESAKQEISNEKAAREALELSLARMGSGEKGEELQGSLDYKNEFDLFIASGGQKDIAEEMIIKEIEKSCGSNARLAAELKMHFNASNPDGGYLVPADMRTEILRRVREMTPFRTVANITSTNRDLVKWPISDDQSQNAVWADELDSRNETDTKRIGIVEIPIHEIYGLPFVTHAQLEDSGINIEQFIRDQVAEDFARAESKAFTDGDGIKRPRGFLNYPVTGIETYKRGSVMERETATNDTLAGDDLIKLQGNIKEPYQANAAWMMNRQFFSGEVATLKDSQGQYLLDPRILFNGLNPVLLGKPVVFNPDLPTAVADAARVAAYGDWRRFYTIADRIMMTVIRDQYTDARGVKFNFRKRVGGGITNFEAVKTLKIQ